MSIVKLYDNLDALPSNLRIYGATDWATMEVQAGKREPDFTEHGVWGLDTDGDLWAVDWWYAQKETDVGTDHFIRLARMHKPIRWFNEGGTIDKAIGPSVRKEMRRKRTYVTITSLPSIEDKAIKLQSFHAMCSAGAVHFPDPRVCRWSEHVIESLVKFPAGRWDDAADVCGLIGRGLDQMVDAKLPQAKETPMLIPYTEKWLTYNERPDKPKLRFFP